jgi:hypothetical protein
MEAQFGSQAQYLIDIYHVCDYLAAAGELIAGNTIHRLGRRRR